MEGRQAWQSVLGQLRHDMPKSAFDTWVKDAQLLSYNDNRFDIGVQNAYARDWLDSRLKTTISQLLSGILDRDVDIDFHIIQTSKPAKDEAQPQRRVTLTEKVAPSTNINGRYTFDTFVVGPSNRLAHAASLAVAEKPAQTYNPLFLYSGVGLGKTHLLHAIGNHCLQGLLELLGLSGLQVRLPVRQRRQDDAGGGHRTQVSQLQQTDGAQERPLRRFSWM